MADLRRLAPGLAPLLVVLAAAAAGWPLFGDAFFGTHDGVMHLYRVQQYVTAWREGTLYPRWAADAALGYGAPIFNFYPPGSYATAGLFALAAFGIIDSYQLTMLGLLLASGLSMYWLGRWYVQPWGAGLAGAAYILAPYHLIDVYARGTPPETFAFVWAPVVLAGLEGLARGRWCWGLAVAVGLGGFALCHLLTALYFAPVFVVWGVLAVGLHARADLAAVGARLGAMAGAAAVGLALASAFLIPAWAEMSQIALNAGTTIGEASIPIFLYADKLALAVFHEYRWLEPIGVGDAGLGLIQAGMAAAGALALAARRRGPALAAGAVCVLTIAIGLFLVDPASGATWNLLTGGISLVWIPFRVYTLVALATAFLTAFAVDVVSRRWQPWTALGATIALGAGSLVNLTPVATPLVESMVTPRGLIAQEAIIDVIALSAGGEYLPATGPRRLDYTPISLAVAAGEPAPAVRTAGTARVDVLEQRSQWRRFAIDAPDDQTIVFNLLWFPAWQASLNGRPLPTVPQESTGLLSVTVPAGVHRLDIRYGSPLHTVSALVSGGVALALAAAVLLVLRRWRPAPAAVRGVVLTSGAGLAILAGAWLLFREASPVAHWDSWLAYSNGGYLRVRTPQPLGIYPPDAIDVVVDGDIRAFAPEISAVRVSVEGSIWGEEYGFVVVPAGPDGRIAMQTVRVALPPGVPSGPYVAAVRLVGVVAQPKPARQWTVPASSAVDPDTIRTFPFAVEPRPATEGDAPLPIDPHWRLLASRLDDAAAHSTAGDRLIAWMTLQADALDAAAPGFVLRLREADGTESLNRTVAPGELAAGGTFWRPGVPVTAPLFVRVPASQPPGAYRATLGVLTPGGNPLLTAGERDLGVVTVAPPARYPPLDTLFKPVPAALASAGGVELLVATGAVGLVYPGQFWALELFWHAPRAPDGDAMVEVHLTDDRGRSIASTRSAVGTSDYRTGRWPPGAVMRTRLVVTIPADTPPGARLRPRVALELAGDTQWVDLPPIDVADRQPRLSPPAVERPLDVPYGAYRLVGINIAHESASAVRVAAAWQVGARPTRLLKYSVQALTEDGRLVSQSDGFISDPAIPPGALVVGEFLEVEARLLLPAAVSRARVVLVVYDAASGVRLVLPTGEDVLVIGSVAQ